MWGGHNSVWGGRPHIFTAQVELVHTLRGWHQQPDEELLCGHVDVWGDLTS